MVAIDAAAPPPAPPPANGKNPGQGAGSPRHRVAPTPAGPEWVSGALAGAALGATAGWSFAGALPDESLLQPVAVGAVVGAGSAVVASAGTRRWRAVAAPVAVLAVVSGALVALGEGPSALIDALGRDGWLAIRDAHAPAPATAATLGVPYLATAAAAFLGTARLLRWGWGLLAAAPSLVVMLLGFMLGSAWEPAPLAVPLAWATTALLASVLLARQRRPETTPRWLAIGLVTAVVVGAAIPLATLLPSSEERWVLPPASQTQPSAASQHPLATVVELRNGPDALLFEASTSAAVPRWRLTALDHYDGQTWSSRQQFRAVSTELPRSEPPDEPQGQPVEQTIDLRLPDSGGTNQGQAQPAWGPWLPVADGVVSTSVEGLMFDLGTGTLVAPDDGDGRRSVPQRYRATSLVGGNSSVETNAHAATDAAGSATNVLPAQDGTVELVEELEAAAEEMTAGATSDYDRAVQIQRYLLTEGELALGEDATGGHTLRHIRDFLLAGDELQGTAEQFASAYALLARSVGLPSRVVVGFEGSAAPGQQQVSAHDATAWVEIRFEELGWVGFEAVPSTTAEVLPPPTTTTTTTPAQPDATQPETPAPASDVPDAEARGSSSKGVSLSAGWSLLAFLSAITIAGLALLTITPGARRAWRRRSWRRRANPNQRVAGAWLWFVQEMRLAGIKPGASVGSTALATRAVERMPALSQQIDMLNGLANRSAFGRRPVSDDDAHSAWKLAETIVRARRQRRRLPQRLRETWTW